MTAANPLEGTIWPVGAFTRPSVVRAWLQEANIRPNRLLGQNFLIDGNILNILLDSAGVGPEDRILEVGPGIGALTAGLLSRGAYVVAVEKDERLLPLLQAHLPAQDRMRIVQGDALELSEGLVHTEKINKVVANLPYTPGTRILVDIATSPVRPALIAVMVQDEVAGRITAEPGSTAFGLVGLWCRIFHTVRYVKRVSPNCFWPRPQVQSAIVQLQRLEQPLLPEAGWPFFQQLSRRLFQQRRKQMGHLLGTIVAGWGGSAEMALGFLPEACRQLRPEALPLDVWCALSENMRMQFAGDVGTIDVAESGDHGR